MKSGKQKDAIILTLTIVEKDNGYYTDTRDPRAKRINRKKKKKGWTVIQAFHEQDTRGFSRLCFAFVLDKQDF